MKQKKKIKLGRYIFLFICVVLGVRFFTVGSINPPEEVYIKSGDGFSTFTKDLGLVEKLRVKRAVRSLNFDTAKVQTGRYVFDSGISAKEFVETIKQGPVIEQIRYTVIEGRSMYDIDADLTKKGYIREGEFLAYVTNKENIIEYVGLLQDEIGEDISSPTGIASLEGIMYPDTYFLSSNADIVKQVVQLSTKRFREVVVPIRKENKDSFVGRISQRGVSLSFYDAITLASIIEKEERIAKEKPTIAGIFINRLEQNITLGADITLCYGMKEPYSSCTNEVIVRGLNDKGNPYNTRALQGLTPTPISSITRVTFLGLLQFMDTDYLFYLHAPDGQIYYAKTNAQHEQNKRQYLR